MVEQKMRFSNKELELLKNTFAEDDTVLKVLRKVFLQIDLSESEDILAKELIRGDVLDLMYKIFLPTIDGDAPLHQIVDLWLTLKLDDKDPDLAYPHIKARELLINYFKQQMGVLQNSRNKSPLKLDDAMKLTGDRELDFVNLVARSTIVSHVEQQLMQIKILAGKKNETVEETLDRNLKNSTK